MPTQQADIALVLAQPLGPQETVLKRLGAVMLLFGLAGVIGAAAAGWAVARNGLRPVRRLTTAVEEIARTERLAPLPVEGDDEIARLATAFNAMLVALSASRDRQRRLVADAGHELRTPLTSLRTNLDLLTQADTTGGLPAEQREELLDDVRAQLEELSTLVGDLVELARDEPLTHVVETFDLAEVVDRAVSRVRLRAPRSVLDVLTLPWWVVGESGAIERAVTNLLDNAAKWGPEGSTVTVRLANGVLTVDDQGPGIDPDGPAARLRALLPLSRVPVDARLRPRAWPSCSRSSGGTPGRCTPARRPAAGPASPCGCRAGRSTRPPARPAAYRRSVRGPRAPLRVDPPGRRRPNVEGGSTPNHAPAAPPPHRRRRRSWAVRSDPR